MVDAEAVRTWVERYVRAWETNEPEDVGGLFTDDATYLTAPYREPWRGRDAIVEGWLKRRDEQGEWAFRWEFLDIGERLAFVRGWTDYPKDGERYANLWCIRLEGDRCAEFVEWWMEER